MAYNSYNSLFNQISKILEETKKDFKEGSNRFVLTSNWEIGKKITEIESGKNRKERFGERIIEKLSKDLNKKFGSGYSERNLLYARKFFQVYNLNRIKFQLSWTHYRALLSVKDEAKRNKLEELAIEKGWSRRQLEVTILAHNLGEKGQNQGNSEEIGLLERSKGLFYHYRIGVQKTLSDSAPRVRKVDLGFNIFLDGALGDTHNFKEDEIVKVVKAGKNSYKFEKAEVSRSEIFTYKASPERIVDGDTILVSIDLGFKTSTRQRLRFRGIDSSEKGSVENGKVEKFISKRLRPVKFIVIKTHGVDLYGRYLSDIYFSEREKDMEKVLEKGIFLNNELLDSGLVRVD
ncbi:MAG: DUF1016 N-terminal domain-containing protein [Leptospira sp.]|nr:DUF1016 N-terminal domain-containing protein [Leptospira sp.]